LEVIRARLKTPAIFDGRNLYDPRDMDRYGIEYFPIGRRVKRGVSAVGRSEQA